MSRIIRIDTSGPELESWLGLAEISQIMPQGWSLAGGSLMRLLVSERNYQTSRSTRDIDVILDVRTQRSFINQFVDALTHIGFTPDGYNTSGQNHRWVRGLAQIDVLVPSGLSERTMGWSFPGINKLLPTRGAQFGINRTSSVHVACSEEKFIVNRPDALGALYEKCSALLNNGDSQKQRHYEDIVILACMLTPDEWDEATMNLRSRERYRISNNLDKAIRTIPEELTTEELRRAQVFTQLLWDSLRQYDRRDSLRAFEIPR